MSRRVVGPHLRAASSPCLTRGERTRAPRLGARTEAEIGAEAPQLGARRRDRTYLEGDYVFGRWFDAYFGAQPERTTSAHHFDELEEVIAAVALGSGASIVPADAAGAAVERGTVRVLRPIAGRRCTNRVFAVTRAGTTLRPELEHVVRTLAITRRDSLDAVRAFAGPDLDLAVVEPDARRVLDTRDERVHHGEGREERRAP